MRKILSIDRNGLGQNEQELELDHDMRNRRRAVFRPPAGEPVLLDMDRVVHLRGGDRLLLDDGSRIGIIAALEPVTEITAPDMPTLIRIAWHLGNRHLPTQLLEGRLLIRRDHVIAEMVEGLGGVCRSVLAPFDPEGGAYKRTTGASHHEHEHDHDQDHDHSHPHAHELHSHDH